MCAVSEEMQNAANYARNLCKSEANKDSFDLQLMYGQWSLDAERLVRVHQGKCEECLEAESVTA
jgi:hypothetical protein